MKLRHRISVVFGTAPALRPVRAVMELRELVAWQRRGRPQPPPHRRKLQTIQAYAHRFERRKFIETGTYLGATVEATAATFESIISIELDATLYRFAKWRFRDLKNVRILHGDSAELVSTAIRIADGPAVFWLDAHFSGGMTARGGIEAPVRAELLAILEDDENEHVVLIDDARAFGTSGYPSVEDMKALIAARRPSWAAYVREDIIRAHRVTNVSDADPGTRC